MRQAQFDVSGSEIRNLAIRTLAATVHTELIKSNAGKKLLVFKYLTD